MDSGSDGRTRQDGRVEIDELYGSQLERFVPERDALARELRSGGKREEAKAVAALRKPSVAAWAVNQLVRTQKREVQALFAAGDALREAQSAVIAGNARPGALRAAMDAERAAVEVLMQRARGLLSSEGHELSATMLDRVTETLQAASRDEEARALVGGGRLERELRHVGLGGLSLGEAASAAPAAPAAKRSNKSKSKGKSESKSKAKARDKADERAAAREAAAREAAGREARKAARAAEREARRELERADRALDAARKRRDKAQRALDDADRELEAARQAAAAAAEAHGRAEGLLATES
jgi:hypothetical protein